MNARRFIYKILRWLMAFACVYTGFLLVGASLDSTAWGKLVYGVLAALMISYGLLVGTEPGKMERKSTRWSVWGD